MAITLENRNRETEAGNTRGFTLIIAVVFMSVMLAIGLALGSLGYKQQILASSAIESQYAFYAADSALECALYYDQKEGIFKYPSVEPLPENLPAIFCGTNGFQPIFSSYNLTTRWILKYRFELDSNTRCADVTVYKYKDPQGPKNITTYIFSQGYNVSCNTVNTPSGARFASRGLSTQY